MKIPADSKLPRASDKAQGMVFPCAIDVKIFVHNHSSEEAVLRAFVLEQLEVEYLLDWSSRESSAGKYLAITARVDAQSRAHIDDLYRALNAHERVIMLI